MPLSYVTVTGTFDDGTGSPLSGSAVFTPSETVYATGIPVVSGANPVTVPINAGTLSTVHLLATDNTGLSFAGLTGFFYWTVAITLGGVAQEGWSFFLPSSPSTVDLYATANTPAGGFVSPLTTLGDLLYENATPAPARLAGNTAAAKRFLTQTGTGTLSAAPAWGTIAVGDVPSLSALGALPVAGGTMTGWLAPAVVSLTFGTSVAVNAALGNVFAVTLTSSAGTLANPTNPVDGQAIRVRVIQDATGSRTLAYGTAYDFGTTGQPTLSTAANAVDILGFEYVASLSKWCYLGSGLGF